MSRPEYPVATPDKGVQRQVLAENSDLMVVSFRFETGACGALHNHPHTQSTYVAKGSFKFFRGDETLVLNVGDSIVIPSNVTHGCECLDSGELIDCFTPRRDDFL
ncbi:cupin domain-containing protein [Paracoccus aestuariivivens]|uniref:Cupin domain-containing protein n=1 Tax=Paracoccus aestuariivivens TaxID=1820333 RepID=A0A6L6JBH0_9RHOB|nr:cupin domain-containing protein [Paracoccus aestuariivivens]MTH77341.1 cupin domain-containing protein [Paracoccus aestuariivivens]